MIRKLLAFFGLRAKAEITALEIRIHALEKAAITDIDEIARRLSLKIMVGIRKEIAKAKKPRR